MDCPLQRQPVSIKVHVVFFSVRISTFSYYLCFFRNQSEQRVYAVIQSFLSMQTSYLDKSDLKKRKRIATCSSVGKVVLRLFLHPPKCPLLQISPELLRVITYLICKSQGDRLSILDYQIQKWNTLSRMQKKPLQFHRKQQYVILCKLTCI